MPSFKSVIILFLLTLPGGRPLIHDKAQPADWCERAIRKEMVQLRETPSSRKWFKVYQVGSGVFAIAEPYNFQEVISYLITGRQKALLFDTGIGMDSILPLVRELTPLPVIVLNSHTHYDHMGGNYAFSDVRGMDLDYTREHAANGWPHEQLSAEVTPAAFCQQRLPGLDTAHYRIRPFTLSAYIHDGEQLDLGGRSIQIIATPGHAPDAISLLDRAAGYLWTGDSYYPGPIYLFGDHTDLDAYRQSMKKLATLVGGLRVVFPSHNIPMADPQVLLQVTQALEDIESGKMRGTEAGDHISSFPLKGFSFLIQDSLLKRPAVQNK
jgi:glyoxylase-like metal-dependent hydrolase (beta-lactamase superfamily II)